MVVTASGFPSHLVVMIYAQLSGQTSLATDNAGPARHQAIVNAARPAAVCLVTAIETAVWCKSWIQRHCLFANPQGRFRANNSAIKLICCSIPSQAPTWFRNLALIDLDRGSISRLLRPSSSPGANLWQPKEDMARMPDPGRTTRTFLRRTGFSKGRASAIADLSTALAIDLQMDQAEPQDQAFIDHHRDLEAASAMLCHPAAHKPVHQRD